MNPPDLILLDGDGFKGDWVAYECELYRIFESEIKGGGLQYCGLDVGCRRLPETKGRWASFWHLVQQGRVEVERTPDLRRCERLRWIRWVIENADSHPEIDVWQNIRDNKVHRLLWFREEYLVILRQQEGYWLLLTAYCTERRGRIKQLRQERNKFRQTDDLGPKNG